MEKEKKEKVFDIKKNEEKTRKYLIKYLQKGEYVLLYYK